MIPSKNPISPRPTLHTSWRLTTAQLWAVIQSVLMGLRNPRNNQTHLPTCLKRCSPRLRIHLSKPPNETESTGSASSFEWRDALPMRSKLKLAQLMKQAHPKPWPVLNWKHSSSIMIKLLKPNDPRKPQSQFGARIVTTENPTACERCASLHYYRNSLSLVAKLITGLRLFVKDSYACIPHSEIRNAWRNLKAFYERIF